MKKTKELEAKRNEAVEALDKQICLQQAKLDYMAGDANTGVNSKEYHEAMSDMVKLCEARAKLADSETSYLKDGKEHKLRVNPNTVIAGAFGLAQIGVLAWMEREHVLPRCVSRAIDSAKEIFKKGE